jgi:chromosome segregation ATPase
MLTLKQRQERKAELSAMNKIYLVNELVDAEDTIARKEMNIADNVDRLSEYKGKLRNNERVVVTRKKRKGDMDKMAIKKWKEFTKLQIWVNILAAIPNILGAAATNEYTHFMLAQLFTNAVIGPAIFYYQKKQERFG